jgi:exodeoxyribonuclease-3
MPISIATWNINSVRLRAPLVERFVAQVQPDVICLQETKCPNEKYPLAAFKRMGFSHHVLNGQKGYNGVAIFSRLPILDSTCHDFGGRPDARHVAATIMAAEPITIHNYYVPAGGDVADVEANPKFKHKLDYLADMHAWARDGLDSRRRSIVVGDLNIAPYASDVWNHKALLDVVSHTPVETEGLENMRKAGGFVDAVRLAAPEPEPVFTWWSYRSPDWTANNRGRRLDHIWMTGDLAGAMSAATVFKDARSWDGPSDHVPVTLTLG